MAQPTPSDVHVNQPLTNISVAYMQDQNEFVADKVFPNVPVLKQSDLYLTFPKAQWFRTEAKPRGISQESAGSGFDVDFSANYSCIIQALHKDIDDRVRANADDILSIDTAAAEYVTRGLLLRKEKDWASKYFKGSLWTGSSTGSDITPSPLWSAANSTPIHDVRTQMMSMKKKTGYTPNVLLLSNYAWTAIADNADFLGRISVNTTRIMTTDLLAQVLGLEHVYVAGGVENTQDEGAAATMDFIYGKHALLVYAPARPSLMTPSAGYTFSWTGYLGASQNGLRMMRLRADLLRSDRVEGEMAYDQKVVAADLGVYFASCVS